MKASLLRLLADDMGRPVVSVAWMSDMGSRNPLCSQEVPLQFSVSSVHRILDYAASDARKTSFNESHSFLAR